MSRISPNSISAAPPFISRQVESSRLFFLDAPEENAEFAVICGGKERCRADYLIDRPGFPWLLLELVVSGAGELVMNGVREELKAGSFYLYGPGVAHRIVTEESQPLVKYFVGFIGVTAGDFLKQYGLEPGFVSRCLKTEPLRRTFDLLIDRGVRKSRLAGPVCEMMTRQILLMCADDAVAPVSTETVAYGNYQRVREFIEQNYLAVNSLDAISTTCQLDGPYLCRLFARFHDETPYQFLTRLRMEYAGRLLLEEEVSVKEAASALGYTDPFHFSRVFKSVHRVPPSRFRQSTHPHWQPEKIS